MVEASFWLTWLSSASSTRNGAEGLALEAAFDMTMDSFGGLGVAEPDVAAIWPRICAITR